MNRSSPIAVGVLGLVALLAAAIFWTIPGIEDDLTTRAEQELSAAGIEGVAVEFDGRDGRLEGAVSEAAVDEVDSLDGVRSIQAEPTTTTTIPPTTTTLPPVPANVSVTLDGTVVNLTGTVESEEARAAILGQVGTTGFDVEDNLVVDTALAGSDAEAIAPLVGPILSGTTGGGELTLNDGTLQVSGEAKDPVEAELIEAALAQVSESDVAVEDMTTVLILSENEQIDAAEKEIDEIFELAREILGKNPSFDTSNGELNPEETFVLDQVIVAFRRYPLPWADVIGHTDSVGSTASNQDLSEIRAMTVTDYLIAGGVDSVRLAPEGRGEEDPAGDNTTEEGRAENRRVDFNVKPSEG